MFISSSESAHKGINKVPLTAYTAINSYLPLFISSSRIYLIKISIELAQAAFIVFLVITFLVFAQQLGKYFDVAFSLGSSSRIAGTVILSLIPNIILITIPLALTFGVVIVSCRLSIDKEFLAFQASGLSWLRISAPFLVIGVIGTVFTAYLSIILVPISLYKMRTIREQIPLVEASSALRPQGFITAIPHALIFIHNQKLRDRSEREIFLLYSSLDQQVAHLIVAERGEFVAASEGLSTVEAHLYNSSSFDYRNFLSAHMAPALLQSSSRAEKLVVNFSKGDKDPTRLSPPPLAELNLSAVSKLTQAKDNIQALIEWHKRLAFPFSCLLLVAGSLFMSFPQKGGFASRRFIVFSSMSLVLAYYFIFIIGQSPAVYKRLPLGLSVWGANAATMLFVLLIALSKTSITRHGLRLSELSWLQFKESKKGSAGRHDSSTKTKCLSGSLSNFLLADYIVRYFLLAAFSLIMTLVIFTLFDLFPSVNKNRIGYAYLGSYLVTLLPQLLYASVPFALMLGMFIAFGILYKTQQIVALFASGLSQGRVILIVLLLASGVGFSLWAFSEYVLPYANRLQDVKYRVIKGKRAEEAASAFDRSWLYGKGGTIYGYVGRDRNNTFNGLIICRLNNSSGALEEISVSTYAVQVSKSLWKSDRGWKDTLTSKPITRQEFNPRSSFLVINDASEILQFLTNDPNKISSGKLLSYIASIKLLGLDTTSLRLDLIKRIAFPASCLTLVLLAMPFILSRTLVRSGTLFYTGLGLSIGLGFWLVMSFCEIIGRQRLLPVSVAVWVPHIVLVILAYTYSFIKKGWTNNKPQAFGSGSVMWDESDSRYEDTYPNLSWLWQRPRGARRPLPHGKQRYWCKACNLSHRDNPQLRGSSEAEKEVILKAYQERTSLRGLECIFGVSRRTVSTWLKKKPPRSRR